MNGSKRRFISVLFSDIRQLKAVGFLAVYDEHGDGCEGGTEGCKAEDEHRGGVGGICLVGLAHTHGDDGTPEVLYEEDHRVGCTQTFQGDDLGYAGPQGSRSQRVANRENHHQGDGNRAAMDGQ